MARSQKSDDQFSPKEAQQRIEAALRGARVSGHKPMSEVPPKRMKPTKKKDAGAGKPQRHST